MKQARPILPLICVLALALCAAWYFSRGEGVRTNAAELAGGDRRHDDSSSLAMPDRKPEPVDAPAPETEEAPTPAILPDSPAVDAVLDTPDYGPAIQRGGALIDFELFDARSARAPVQDYGVKLWRKIGSYWIADEASADADDNVIRCDGLGEANVPAAGLEPGAYELDLTSQRWGNFRHEFSVSRGEKRTERLTTPHTKVAVCFRFIDAAGNPIAYLPAPPSVATTSVPMEPRERPGASTVELVSPPGRPEARFGGMGWMSSRSGSGRPYEYDFKPLYPTDDGAWWVHVYAGATNTVTFPLQELWGAESYELVDTFTSRSEVTVTLNTVDNFATRVLEWGKPVKNYSPGHCRILDEPLEPRVRPEFDPYTAPVSPGVVRPVIELTAPMPVRIEMSLDGQTCWREMNRRGNLYWYDLSTSREYYIRFVDDRLLRTTWERLEIAAEGVLPMRRELSGPVTIIDTDGLSPTLRAFAHTIDFDVAASRKPDPEPVEDDSIKTEPDPDDTPNKDLKPNPQEEPTAGGPVPNNNRQVDLRVQLPADADLLFKIVIRPDHDMQRCVTMADNEQSGAASSEGLMVRTHLRGTSRFRKGGRGNAGGLPDGRFWFEPVILNGRWDAQDTAGGSLLDLLKAGTLQPRFDNVFVARAVGSLGEGLPWVKGVIVDYESDAIAQQVREICARSESRLVVTAGEGYAGKLAAVEADETRAGLRELIGDEAYGAFESNEQRLWFAQHGAWYDTGRKVYSDDQGYIAKQDPPLTPGKCYVLYLWSNSRDDLRPDARFAFKVDENGVADLGAIRLPTYVD